MLCVNSAQRRGVCQEMKFLTVRLIALLLACALPTGAWAVPQGPERERDLLQRVERAIDRHVLPTLTDFSKKAHALSDSLGAFCRAGDAESLRAVNAAFRATVLAWARAEHLRFGPLRGGDVSMRINFWPDPRGVVFRQMRRVLQAENADLLDPAVLAKQSVAVQGLGSLEIILLRWARKPPVDQGAGRPDYDCRLAKAIAGNVANVSDMVLQSWMRPGGWRSRLLNPGPDDAIYLNVDEVAGQITKSLLLGVALLRDQHVLLLFELATGERRRIKLPFQRSGLSVAYIQESVKSLKQLHEQFRLTDYARGEVAWTKEWVGQTFGTLERAVDELELPGDRPIAKTDVDETALRRLRFYTNGLRQVIGRALAPAAGLTIGFNELDGD